MIDLGIDVTLRLAGLQKILKGLQAGSQTPEVREMLESWAVRYRGFLTERFLTLSQGGGIWPPLKYRDPIPGILWKTGTLIDALTPTDLQAAGSVTQILPSEIGVTVGYGGEAEHPDGNGATIAEIAGYHQRGGPKLPRRPPIDDPDARTINGMARDAKVCIAKLKNA
jgi:hypothetical protein